MSKNTVEPQVSQVNEKDTAAPAKRRESIKNTSSKGRKAGRILLRSLVLAITFCFVIYGGVAISDMFSSGDENGTTPEIITLTISGEDIILENSKVSFDDLRTYLRNADEKGELYTVAVINDTGNPADYLVYNQVVDLLAEYGIVCEKMDPPATSDEYSVPVTEGYVQN